MVIWLRARFEFPVRVLDSSSGDALTQNRETVGRGGLDVVHEVNDSAIPIHKKLSSQSKWLELRAHWQHAHIASLAGDRRGGQRTHFTLIPKTDVADVPKISSPRARKVVKAAALLYVSNAFRSHLDAYAPSIAAGENRVGALARD